MISTNSTTPHTSLHYLRPGPEAISSREHHPWRIGYLGEHFAMFKFRDDVRREVDDVVKPWQKGVCPPERVGKLRRGRPCWSKESAGNSAKYCAANMQTYPEGRINAFVNEIVEEVESLATYKCEIGGG